MASSFRAPVLLKLTTFFFLWNASVHVRAEPTQPSVGEIGALRGRVLISRKVGSMRQQSAALRKEAFYEGDEITTAKASDVLLHFQGGHTVRLGPESFYRVTFHRFDAATEENRSLTQLFYGRMRAEVETLYEEDASAESKAKKSFEVRTPNAILGVRGTTFFATYDEASRVSQIMTKEGSVGARAAHFNSSGSKILGSSRETVVAANQQTSIAGTGTTQKLPHMTEVQPLTSDTTKAMEESFEEKPTPEVTAALDTAKSQDKLLGKEPDTNYFEFGASADSWGSLLLACAGTTCYDTTAGFGLHATWYGRDPDDLLGWGWRLSFGGLQVSNSTSSISAAWAGFGPLLHANFKWGIHADFSFLPVLGMVSFTDPILFGVKIPITVGWEHVWDQGWRIGVKGGGLFQLMHFINLDTGERTSLGGGNRQMSFSPYLELFAGFSY